jgi:hypothetical protein
MKKFWKEFWMEDVREITVNATVLIENALKEFNIVLTDEEEDDIHNKIWEVLEKRSNGDYKNHM